MAFKDYFSRHSVHYARFRPGYPPALFRFLSTLVEERKTAWDCATGNGQTAVSLSKFFKNVIATDGSEAQLNNAPQVKNIEYKVSTAEKTPIKKRSVDLITVSQAIHWFDFDLFYKEVKRVSKPDAVIAIWCYGLNYVENGQGKNKKLTHLTADYYNEIVGDYWPKERKYVEEEYRTIPFPFKEIKVPQFAIEVKWNLEKLLGYLSTWSSTQRYIEAHGSNPLERIAEDMASAWGNPKKKKKIVWPLYIRAGRVE